MGDLVSVGRVGRPHGLDGAFIVERPSDDERRYVPGASLLVDGVPATVVLSRRAGGNRRAIKLDRPVERGQELAVRRADLPPPDPDHYYVVDLVGLTAVDEGGRILGIVDDVLPGVANDNLVLSSGALVPLVEDAIREVDLEGRRLVVASDFVE